jgi:hypothetical protein
MNSSRALRDEMDECCCNTRIQRVWAWIEPQHDHEIDAIDHNRVGSMNRDQDLSKISQIVRPPPKWARVRRLRAAFQ